MLMPLIRTERAETYNKEKMVHAIFKAYSFKT